MGRTQTIFIALAGSIVLHLVGLELYARYGSALLITPPRLTSTATTRPTTRPTTQPDPDMVVTVEPTLPDFGESTGTGIASNKSEGDRPQEAREADENQAYLDRQRTGNSVEGNAKQLMPNAGASGATAMQPKAAPVMTPPTPIVPTDVKPDQVAMAPIPPADPPPLLPNLKPDADEPKASTSVVVTSQPAPKVDPVLPTPAPKPPTTPPPVQQQQVAQGNNGAPPVQGLMVPHSDSDSDPFMRLSGSVVFRAGKLDVQMGRKVNTVRPQLGIGGITEALTMAAPSLMVEAHIDSIGRVTEVDLRRKTGSPAIDEPTRNAVYQWTFEPTRDKQGRAIADVIFFEIDYR